MVKHSYEDTYAWQSTDRWGVSASAEVVKWATKTYDEGLVECKADSANLKDFNATLKSLRKKLNPQQDEEEAATPGASATKSTWN